MFSPTRKVAHGVRPFERSGRTPLIRLERTGSAFPDVEILGKAEWANPGGSVKDRAARNIVAQAQQSGQLGHGRALLDATSGNTGIAYAMLGASMGFPVTLCVPANASAERRRILSSLGAQVIVTDPAEGTDGAIERARALAAAEPERYFYADQYA